SPSPRPGVPRLQSWSVPRDQANGAATTCRGRFSLAMSWGSASSDGSISFDLAFTSFLHADCQSNSRGTRKKVRPDGGSCRIEVPMRVKRTMDFAADRLPSCLLATARNWRASQADGLPCGHEFAQGCEFAQELWQAVKARQARMTRVTRSAGGPPAGRPSATHPRELARLCGASPRSGVRARWARYSHSAAPGP